MIAGTSRRSGCCRCPDLTRIEEFAWYTLQWARAGEVVSAVLAVVFDPVVAFALLEAVPVAFLQTGLQSVWVFQQTR